MLFNVTVRREDGILETHKSVDGLKFCPDWTHFDGFPIVSVEKVPQEQIDAELSYFNKFGTGCE